MGAVLGGVQETQHSTGRQMTINCAVIPDVHVLVAPRKDACWLGLAGRPGSLLARRKAGDREALQKT